MKLFRRCLIALLLFAVIAAAVEVNIYFSGARVMVYMYHSVSAEPFNPDDEALSVLPEQFEKQLAYFVSRGIETVFASELPELDETTGPRRVVLTFDDGYEDNYTEAFPLLKKYGCKATIFMIASCIDTPGYLTSAQLREMTDSGLVSIQSHTVSHVPMAWGDKTYEDVVYELRESRRIIEEAAGAPVTVLSIPNGSFDETIIDIAKDYYSVAFTGTGLRNYSKADIMDIYRVGIYRRHSASDVRRMTDHRVLYVAKRGLEKLLGIE